MIETVYSKFIYIQVRDEVSKLCTLVCIVVIPRMFEIFFKNYCCCVDLKDTYWYPYEIILSKTRLTGGETSSFKCFWK